MEAISVTRAEVEALLIEHFPCPGDWPNPADWKNDPPVLDRLANPTQGGLRNGASMMERVMTKLPYRTKIPGHYVRIAPLVRGERPVHDLDMAAQWTKADLP